MLLDNEKKEHLSHAYVHAVATKAGFSCRHFYHPDNESVDVQISSNSHLDEESKFNPVLEMQLKATATHEFNESILTFPLSKKNYVDLRGPSIIPRLLVILLMPKDEAQWLIHSEDELVAKKCAYWYSLRGLPDKKIETITVKVPRGNVFSPNALQSIMLRISKGEEINNAL